MSDRRNGSGFFTGVDIVANFVFANLIWVVVSLTIIGIPLAMVGIFAMMSQLVRGKQPEFFNVFISAIRENWKQALVVGVIDLLAGAFILVNLFILGMMNPMDILAILSRSLTVCVGVIFVIVNIYIWFLMASVDLPLKKLGQLALLLVATYPVRSFVITLLTLIPIIVSLLLPPLFFMFVTISISVFIASYGAWHVIHSHFTTQELEAFHLLSTPTKQDNS